MNRKMIHPLLLTCALVPAVAMAFGNQTTWTRGWGQGVTTIRQSSQNSLSSPKIRSRTPLFLLHRAHLFIPSPAVAFPCRARKTKESRPPEDRK